jgi:perosamine synthetase
MGEKSLIFQLIPYWGDEEKEAVMKVLEGDFINEHKRVREFEEEFAKSVGAKYCVACTSGSMALYMALQAVPSAFPSGVPTKVPTYMGIFIAHALKQVDIIPSFVDVNTLGLSDEVRNVFYVHANGRVHSDVNITLEDCCQAVSHHTKGAISAYSFAPTKHLTTFGQGGMVATDDFDVYEVLCGVKDHGRTERAHMKPVKDEFTKWGTNLKMTEAQGAFGLVQLKHLPSRLKRFEEIYDLYKEELSNTVGFLPTKPSWQVDIMTPKPKELIEHLRKHQILSGRVHKPTHLHPEFNDGRTRLPSSEEMYSYGVFLPSTTNLTDENVMDVCHEIKGFLK